MFEARDFLVRDGDTVYVTEAPFVQWTKTLAAFNGTATALSSTETLGSRKLSGAAPRSDGRGAPRRLFVYNGGLLRPGRIRRILTLAGYCVDIRSPRPGRPGRRLGPQPLCRAGRGDGAQGGRGPCPDRGCLPALASPRTGGRRRRWGC